MAHRRTVLAVFVLGCAVWGSSAAQVDLPADGVITAKRYATVVEGSRVSIEIRNFEDYSRELTVALGRALAQRGFIVVEEGDLILFVDTSTNAGAEGQPEPLPVEGSTLPTGTVGSQVAVPLGLEERGTGQGLRYSMTVTLSARGRPPTWIGNASAVVSGGDRQSVFSLLGYAVVSTIGDDVEDRHIEIR